MTENSDWKCIGKTGGRGKREDIMIVKKRRIKKMRWEKRRIIREKERLCQN